MEMADLRMIVTVGAGRRAKTLDEGGGIIYYA
jgi:hypothetical protein